MAYFKTGQLKSEKQGTQETIYEYNARGAVIKIAYVQNAKPEEESFTYNSKGLLKSKTLRHATIATPLQPVAPVVLTYIYEYEIDLDDDGEDETDFLAKVKVGNKVIREFGDYTQSDVSFYELGQPKYAIEHNRFKPNGAVDVSY